MTGGSVGPVPAGTIVVARDMTPSRFLEIDWSKVGGIALEGGSAQSHVAMLARSRGVPMVVGLGKLEVGIATTGLLNGTRGTFITDPDDYQIDWFEADREIADKEKQAEAALLAEPARTSGGQLVRVMINVANPAELDHLDVTHCDGIGLMRSEFLFSDGKPLPDEETQYHAYRRCLEWAAGRPVTIRTLDIGGDKPIKGVTREGEANPFLGTRGVRLTLSYENRELFNTQLRALARAAVHGPLKVMWPMVSLAFEHREASLLMDQAIDALHGEGIDCARPLLGIMVEVPAAALAPATIGPADFYSIGTNDLTQYVFAYARDMSGLTNYYLPGHQAVISLDRERCRARPRDRRRGQRLRRCRLRPRGDPVADQGGCRGAVGRPGGNRPGETGDCRDKVRVGHGRRPQEGEGMHCSSRPNAAVEHRGHGEMNSVSPSLSPMPTFGLVQYP